MRRWLTGILLAVAIGALAFFALAPGIVERGLNQIDGKPLPAVSARAKALHETLTIVDLHSDSLLWSRDFLERATRGHMDLPRLEEGNVALQVLASTTQSPKSQNYDANGADTDNITGLVIAQLQPVRTWDSLLERSLWHAEKLDRFARADGRKLRTVMQKKHIEVVLDVRNRGQKLIGAMLSVEGLHNLEGDIANLDKLYAAGFRMAGLTHFFDNDLAGSMHGLKKGGLTPFGRRVVTAMEAKGMIVDVAHCSKACVADILKMARRPVVSSHGGVQATCKVNRNLTDEEIRGVARTGGVIGIGYWDAAVCDLSPRSIARAIRYVRELVGIQYVALGSDFDGSTTTRFDVSQLVQVTQALIDDGFTPDEIRSVMGGNALRVLRAGLVPMPEPVQKASR